MTTPLLSPPRSESKPRPADPIRVLVVDDSAVVRAFVTRRLGAEPDVEVVGTARDGAAAIDAVAANPVDVVVLDVEMPVLDGLAALPRILAAQKPPPKVVMASTLTHRGASVSIQALVRGAADYLPKPTSLHAAAADQFGDALVERIKVWGRLRARGPATRPAVAKRPPPAPPPASRLPRVAPQALAIGCSTGGPQALLALFDRLRGRQIGPIFVTQHMPPTFTTLFAEQLARASGRPCREATDGERVVADGVYLAPGDWHLIVDGAPASARLRTVQTPPVNYCRPAVDPMLLSLVRVYGKGLLTLILTGMGQDGLEGCRAVAGAGGTVLVQDEATSVVWGMPGAVARAGLAREVLEVEGLADRVSQAFGRVA
ncbi:MAG: chemotaxis-specific protein-glutamate methyltransferase CheB [Pseudomonadota bacterium]